MFNKIQLLFIFGIVFLLATSITLKSLAYSMLNNPSFDKKVYDRYSNFGMISLMITLGVSMFYSVFVRDSNSLSPELYECEKYGKVSGYFDNNALHEKASEKTPEKPYLMLVILILSYIIFGILSHYMIYQKDSLTAEEIKLHKIYNIISDISGVILFVFIIGSCIKIKRGPKILEKQLYECEKDGKISEFYKG